jgi:hypothetical protein
MEDAILQAVRALPPEKQQRSWSWQSGFSDASMQTREMTDQEFQRTHSLSSNENSGQQAVRFALVAQGSVGRESGTDAGLEILLTSGERLRVGAGVDAAAVPQASRAEINPWVLLTNQKNCKL